MKNRDGRQEPWETMKADEICAGKVRLESEEYSKYQVKKQPSQKDHSIWDKIRQTCSTVN